MYRLKKPSDDRISEFIESQSRLEFTYAAVGSTQYPAFWRTQLRRTWLSKCLLVDRSADGVTDANRLLALGLPGIRQRIGIVLHQVLGQIRKFRITFERSGASLVCPGA